MKRLTLLLGLLLLICAGISAQQPKTIWKIFCSGSCDFETFETGPVKQDFIDVIQDDNKFYWGKDNVYTVYNKKENHNGFMSYTTYDFIDRHNQRGTILYQHNRGADWATKHIFYIQYEGVRMGKFYCSNEPQDR